MTGGWQREFAINLLEDVPSDGGANAAIAFVNRLSQVECFD